ncbi:NAC domain containing protein 50-like isoform X2 [Quercus lobata]|uniref:NAC domain containing protein 50-like isoform X2 n=1 Tax=Quercus lobata TaxID=97700 RepID=UPI00124507A2|nr:NAC domain containing protein 50-like isoform X2 [Quercus lobata]
MEKLSLDLPPGFRFSPTDKELIELFLKPKITGNDEDIYFVPEVEFYKLEPWDLQYKSGIDTKDQEWFFFAAQGLQHQKGKGRNRKTEKGYWKVTGNDREIKSEGKVIGMKKTLVFHIGRSRKGTKWVMHEYRTTLKDLDGTHPGQKAFVLCRLFNNEEKSNKGGPAKSKPALAPVSPALEVQAEKSNQSCYAEISDQMMPDATEPVQCNNHKDYHNEDVAENQVAEVTSSEVDFNKDMEHLLHMFYVPSAEDSPSSLCANTSGVSTPITVISSCEAMQSEPTLAPAPQAFPEQVEKHQVAEVKATEFKLEMEEAHKMFYSHPPEPLDCNFFSPSTLTPVAPAVSFPAAVKASLEEGRSMPALASVSTELGSEADNYPTSFRRFPAEKSDGIISNTIAPIEYNGYNTYVGKDKVAEVASDELGVSSEPLGCNMLYPLHSQMQEELGSSCSSYPFPNYLYSGHWGVHHQYGTNEPAPNISESWGLTLGNCGDCLHYTSFSSQNNLAFDNETQINMVSAKDNLADANARIELEHQDLVWLDEIINPEVSLGLLKSASYIESVGRSSDEIIGSD